MSIEGWVDRVENIIWLRSLEGRKEYGRFWWRLYRHGA